MGYMPYSIYLRGGYKAKGLGSTVGRKALPKGVNSLDQNTGTAFIDKSRKKVRQCIPIEEGSGEGRQSK